MPLTNQSLMAEFIWEGKYDENGVRRPVRLPDFDVQLRKREEIGQGNPRNLLIHGDNKLALSALMAEYKGKVNLIYIDPPFCVGSNFRMNGPGERSQVAYRDVWGSGSDSYLHTLWERLVLLRNLLAEDGTIYVHVDWRTAAQVRLILDEVFGSERFQNEIIWCYREAINRKEHWNRKHDNIYVYTKSDRYTFNWQEVLEPYSESALKKYRYRDEKGPYRLMGRNLAGSPIQAARDISPEWEKSHPELVFRHYLKPGKLPVDYWLIDIENQASPLRTGYDTQKPEALLERIIKASSNPGDLVLDCYCGSGTTLAVAHKLDRRWIGIDQSRYAIQTTCKRMISLYEDKSATFDLCDLFPFEQKWWLLNCFNGDETACRASILKAFGAEILTDPPSPLLHGMRDGAYISVIENSRILHYNSVCTVIEDAQTIGAGEVLCLAWELEPGLIEKVEELSDESGIRIGLRIVPREIIESNRTEVTFYKPGKLRAEAFVHQHPETGETWVDVRLVSFTPSQPDLPVESSTPESSFDCIDSWSVDFFHYEGKPYFTPQWHAVNQRRKSPTPVQIRTVAQCRDVASGSIIIKATDIHGYETKNKTDIIL